MKDGTDYSMNITLTPSYDTLLASLQIILRSDY